jgi:creatinine amidohydrolase/Fe(II)-dependent formamide hydrolase-like protein
MRKFLAAATLAAGLTAAGAFAPSMSFAAAAKTDLVEFGMMTWPEVKAAIAAGKTTALVYTGGTEQRGPQNVNGGHTLMGEATVKAIAEKLGNAIAMPVLPFTPNRASADLPGTIGLTNELLAAVLERIAEESIATGFKNVVLMGDHGGGQGPLGPKNVYDTVAKKLDAKYAPKGIHVYYCDQVYEPANDAFDKYLESQHLPKSAHAGIPDTSEMLYLGGDKGWVRKDLIATALGDPVPADGHFPSPAEMKVKNGIMGDARASTVELGKKIFDMKVDYAVKQIQGFIKPAKAG